MARYVGVGVFQFVLDLQLFLRFQHLGPAIVVANTASRLPTSMAGYSSNRKSMFPVKSANGYSMLPLAWDAFLAGKWSPGLGKFWVEAALAVLGFFNSKLWVYRHAQR